MTARDARRASDKLTVALLNAAVRGERAHCSDPATHHYWTSEHPAERSLAALACRGCPVAAECLAAAIANDERWGVWGGKDFSRRPGRAKRLKQAGRDDDLFSVA
jgi:Transcription factor WhiB